MVIRESWLSILPFFVLFLLNNYGLVPYFLFKKRYWQYTVSLIFVIGMICWLSPFSFANHSPKDFKRGELPLRMKENRRDQIIKMREKAREEGDVHWYESNPEQRPRGMGDPNGPGRFPKPTPFPYPPFVLRYLIHFIIAFLMVGFNIAIKLFFKSFRDEEMLKELEHQRLQSELEYLKYQINPHFFMNTLNNIHALIDIDTEYAKSAVIELSKMMRYVLYESGSETISLKKDIQFIENYIELMRIRYDSSIDIRFDYPDSIPNKVAIPPLLLIVFVENAFKHGVSYNHASFIQIRIGYRDDAVTAVISNSRHEKSRSGTTGIGLENVKKRLALIYQDNYTLAIDDSDPAVYTVKLIIPIMPC